MLGPEKCIVSSHVSICSNWFFPISPLSELENINSLLLPLWFYFWEPNLELLKAYSLLCALGSLLTVLSGANVVPGIKSGTATCNTNALCSMLSLIPLPLCTVTTPHYFRFLDVFCTLPTHYASAPTLRF